jgi:hypothetical protein
LEPVEFAAAPLPRISTRPPPAPCALDRLAAAALREAARMKRKPVERDVVGRVIEVDTRERARAA